MKDQHPYVRDTTAWTIGRAFEFLHDTGNPDIPACVTQETLPPIIGVSAWFMCVGWVGALKEGLTARSTSRALKR